MTHSTIWWLLAGVAVGVELVTGTFYLLMLAAGLVAAALAAHLGATVTVQLAVAAVVGGGSVLAWRAYRQRAPSTLPAGANHDVNLDIGETVHVEAWEPDGTGAVKYRGAQWQVALMPGAAPLPGSYVIVEVVGNRLVVRKV